jgi:tryptophan synthase alpha chain
VSGNGNAPAIYHRLKSIGVDALLCPELPLEESAQHEAYLKASGLGCVHMVFPNTPLDRAAQSFERSSAFTYVVARSGITGASQSLDSALQQRLGELNKISEKPKVVGFGLSTQEHVRSVWAAGADGSIVASQFVRWMQELPFDEAKAKVVEFVRALA